MLIEREIYEGTIDRDVFGSWSDCSPGLYIDHDLIDTIFQKYEGRKVRIIIEPVEEVKD